MLLASSCLTRATRQQEQSGVSGGHREGRAGSRRLQALKRRPARASAALALPIRVPTAAASMLD
jgi:hypothetical protein